MKTRLWIAVLLVLSACGPSTSGVPIVNVSGTPLPTAPAAGPTRLSESYVVIRDPLIFETQDQKVRIFQSDVETILRNPDWDLVTNCQEKISSVLQGTLEYSGSITFDGGYIPTVLHIRKYSQEGFAGTIDPIEIKDGAYHASLEIGASIGDLEEDTIHHECVHLDQHSHILAHLMNLGLDENSSYAGMKFIQTWIQLNPDALFMGEYLPWWYQCKSAHMKKTDWYQTNYEAGTYGRLFCDEWLLLFPGDSSSPDFGSEAWRSWGELIGNSYLKYHSR